MRNSQLIIRIVVFCCIAFNPSGDGSGLVFGILLGIALGSLIGFFDAKTGLVPRQEPEADSE